MFFEGEGGFLDMAVEDGKFCFKTFAKVNNVLRSSV